MKSVYKNLHLILTVLFIAGTLYSAYLLYNLPIALEKASGKIDLNAIDEARPVLIQIYVVIGLTLVIGFTLMTRYLYIINSEREARGNVLTSKEDIQENRYAKDSRNESDDNFDAQVQEIRSVAQDVKDEKSRIEKLLSKLCMKIEASQGIYYTVKKDKQRRYIEMLAAFAFSIPESTTLTYEFGEGLAGQAAREGKKLNISNVPEGYIKILSGLGSASPNHLAILPVKEGDQVVAVVEIASFREIAEPDEKLIAEVFKTETVKSKSAKEEKTLQSDEASNPKKAAKKK